MKKILFSLILIATHVAIYAQKPVVKISPEIKLAKDISFQSHLFSDATGHYLYFYEGDISLRGYSVDKVILEKYSPSLNSVMKKEYLTDKKGMSTFGIKYFQGKFAMLNSLNNKKEGYVQYTLVPIDLNGTQGNVTTIAKVKYDSKEEIPTIQWDISADSSKLMFLATVDDDNDDKNAGVFASVIDKSYTPLWSRKYQLKRTEEQYFPMSSVVTNSGDGYVITKIYEGIKAKESKKVKKKSKPAYEIFLMKFTQGSETVEEFKLELGNSFIRSASLKSSKSGDMYCTGFYSDRKEGALQGVFFLKLGPDGAILAQTKKEFSVADLKMFGERNTDEDRRDDLGLEDNFKFSDFLIADDGSAVVVCEQNYTEIRTHYDPYNVNDYENIHDKFFKQHYTSTKFYYNRDMVTFSINSAGNIENVAVIPKHQVSADPFYQGYAAMVRDKTVVFFYNDDEDNMKKPVNNPKPKKISSFKDCVTVMTTLDESGKLTRKQLFEASEVKSEFIPKNSIQISKNEMFFTTKKLKSFGKTAFHIGTVTLPN